MSQGRKHYSKCFTKEGRGPQPYCWPFHGWIWLWGSQNSGTSGVTIQRSISAFWQAVQTCHYSNVISTVTWVRQVTLGSHVRKLRNREQWTSCTVAAPSVTGWSLCRQSGMEARSQGREEELVVLPWGLGQVFCLPILKAAFFLSCSPVNRRPEPGLCTCLEALWLFSLSLFPLSQVKDLGFPECRWEESLEQEPLWTLPLQCRNGQVSSLGEASRSPSSLMFFYPVRCISSAGG